MAYSVSVEQVEEREVFGKSVSSNDRTVARDIDQLAKMHGEVLGTPAGGVVPLFVVSRDYDPSTGDFELFVGGMAESDGLERFVIPAGTYARIEIASVFAFMWGVAVGRAKRWLYTRWLPSSGFEALNLEYEYHTQKSLGKHPQVDLMFAVKERRA